MIADANGSTSEYHTSSASPNASSTATSNPP